MNFLKAKTSNKKIKGIILAGGYGTRLRPLTKCFSKHLLAIYDKPMIYYSISLLIDCGIYQIAIITNKESLNSYKAFFGDGSKLGIEIEYIIQENPNGLPEAYILAEKYLDGCSSLMMLGDNVIYNPDLGNYLYNNLNELKSAIFTLPVSNPNDFGIIELDNNKKILSIEEKPKHPKSNLAIIGLYYFDENASKFSKSLMPSQRSELEITDLMKVYLSNDELSNIDLGKNSTWFDTGTPQRLLEASNFISTIQSKSGSIYGSPEISALNKKLIDAEDLIEQFANEKGFYAKSIMKELDIFKG